MFPQIQALASAADRTQKQTAKYKELIGALVQAEDVRGLQVSQESPGLAPPYPLPTTPPTPPPIPRTPHSG